MSTYKDGNKPKNPVSFPKAMQILERLLKGEIHKNIAVDEGVSSTTVSAVKRMFPLFFQDKRGR